MLLLWWLVGLFYLGHPRLCLGDEGYDLAEQSKFFEEDYRSYHMPNIVKLHCPANALTPAEYSSCVNQTESSVRSFKLSLFYYYKQELFKQVSGLVRPADRPEYDIFVQEAESTLPAYHHKLSIVQDYADDSRVKNICLVGFQGGLSLLNFLSSNPTARILVFDPLHSSSNSHQQQEEAKDSSSKQSLFQLLHYQSILKYHKKRAINWIVGDIKQAVRNYFQLFASSSAPHCQLLYIDIISLVTSAMEAASLFETILPLVDPVYNRVIVNDFEKEVVNVAFQYVYQKVHTGIFCPTCDAAHLPAVAADEITSFDSIHTAQCESRYKTNATVLRYFQGFLPTPCVAMYTNETGTRHVEFLLSIRHCMPNAAQEEVKELEVDDQVQLIITQMTHQLACPDDFVTS
eukprot:gene1387-1508_t